MKRLEQITEFLIDVRGFQEVYRFPEREQSDLVESDAEHSWSVAMACLVLLPELQNEYDERINETKVLQMALIHDLAELRTGDTAPWDAAARANKDELEAAAMKDILSKLPEPQQSSLLDLWRECEAKESLEAKIVKSIDRIDPPINRLALHQSWGIKQPEHATLSAFDDRNLSRHSFSKTMSDWYALIRAKVQKKFKLQK